MKPETKSLLDRYQKLNRQDFNSETRMDFMRVCDVEELVEELTKWHRVEDGLPAKTTDIFSDDVLCKNKSGKYVVRCYDYEMCCWTGFYFSDVIEWRYIY